MKKSRSSLFLIELTISILFFALASAACIQLFVKAHLLDTKRRRQIRQSYGPRTLRSCGMPRMRIFCLCTASYASNTAVNRTAFI